MQQNTKEFKILNETLQENKNFLEANGNKYGGNCSFRSNKDEISMVKQETISSNTCDGKRCYIDKYNSVPWGYNPRSLITQRTINMSHSEQLTLPNFL